MNDSTLKQYGTSMCNWNSKQSSWILQLNQYICEGLRYDLQTTLKSRFYLVMACKTIVVKEAK